MDHSGAFDLYVHHGRYSEIRLMKAGRLYDLLDEHMVRYHFRALRVSAGGPVGIVMYRDPQAKVRSIEKPLGTQKGAETI
jgi:hypothetical protein